MKRIITITGLLSILLSSCSSENPTTEEKTTQPKDSTAVPAAIQPTIVTEPTKHDTDDPCIWINKDNPSQSLIIGTDKDEDGALYVYDLEGKIVQEKVVPNLKRPNNVDLEYGFMLDGKAIDIAVTSERLTHMLRIYSVPDMKLIGSIEAFKGEEGTEFRDLMGVALYKDPNTKSIYVIAGRKNGPTDGTYLWQYLLKEQNGQVTGELVRKFGDFSGQKEIEAIAVDNELGYIYYSDENVGIRKYYAHPDSSNTQLALFATEGIQDDHEGISIYKYDDSTGYILLSDQQAGEFHIFPREGTPENPHDHPLVKVVKVSTLESDGSDVTSLSLNDTFKGGLFVAMSEGKVFHYYKWADIAGEDLKVKE